MDSVRGSIVGAMRAKLAGNEQLRNGKILEAREMYVEGLRHVLAGVEALKTLIETGAEAEQFLHMVRSELEEVRVQLISNLALTELKMELWPDALAHSEMVLVAEPGNQKAVFRRSVARIRLAVQLDEAKIDLEKLLSLDPNNVDLVAELARCKAAKNKTSETEFQKNFKGKLTSAPKTSFSDFLRSMIGSWGTSCAGLRSVV